MKNSNRLDLLQLVSYVANGFKERRGRQVNSGEGLK
jgi:hypothetical protein